jgi:hypothetical protein
LIVSQSKQRIIESLDDLPNDSLSALAEFAEYLRAKALTPRPAAVVESNESLPASSRFSSCSRVGQMSVPQTILELVERFDRQRDAYRSGDYNEARLRREFLDPFFGELGWDM